MAQETRWEGIVSMPGLLKKSARCPECDEPIIGLSDLSNRDGVTREYFHTKSLTGRRRRPCIAFYDDHDIARRERAALEVHRRAS